MTFKKASLCRHFENEVYKRVQEKKINFPVYLSAGQEYVPSSIAQLVHNKKIKPMLFGQHRGHSIYLSFGGDVTQLIDELLGMKSGCTRGMGGSLSISSKKLICLDTKVLWEAMPVWVLVLAFLLLSLQ